MNGTAQNAEKSKPSTLDAKRTEPNYPWTAPNWRTRVDPNHSGPSLDSSSYPVSEPDYPWQREYQQSLQHPPEPPQPQPMSREHIPFGQRIRELRRARGWTQRQVASALGVNVRTVIRHERGRTRRPWVSLLTALRRLEKAMKGTHWRMGGVRRGESLM
jgi:DNA-binding XRE family transcriptional regulator